MFPLCALQRFLVQPCDALTFAHQREAVQEGCCHQSRKAAAAHQSRRAAVTAVTVRQLLWLTLCQNRKKDIVVQRACPIGLRLPSLRLPCTGRAPAATRRSAPWVSCHRSVPNSAWCWGCPGLWNSRGPETRLRWSTLQAAAAFGWHERLSLSAVQAHALSMHAHASQLPSAAKQTSAALSEETHCRLCSRYKAWAST